MRWLGWLVTVALLGAPASARADHIDDLITDVASPSVRSSVKAAIDLSKSGDPRAVRAFTFFAVNHGDEHVRRLAVIALGRLVSASTPVADRRDAVLALREVVRRDASRKNRRTARRTLDQIHKAMSSASGGAAATAAVVTTTTTTTTVQPDSTDH